MRTRCVALVTRDPALYSELASALRERKIPSVSLLPGDRIPDRANVVLTSESEAGAIGHPHVLALPLDGDRTAFWAAVESAFASDDRAAELVVGIDPGPRPGYAVVSAGRRLACGVLDSPEAAAELGRLLRHRFATRPIRFRVGSGDRPARNRILNSLLELRRPVEVVDEGGTTPRGLRSHRDARAAEAIARTSGRVVREIVPLVFTRGEIANLQRLSREGSGGKFTIPRSLADRVLRGEMSLGDAIADRARRYAERGLHDPARARSSSEPS